MTTTAADLTSVKNIVVIYAENRSFDNLYGNFPGANGLQNVTPASAHAARPRRQRARHAAADLGRPDATGVTPVVTQAMTANLPNAPFRDRRPERVSTRRSP